MTVYKERFTSNSLYRIKKITDSFRKYSAMVHHMIIFYYTTHVICCCDDFSTKVSDLCSRDRRENLQNLSLSKFLPYSTISLKNVVFNLKHYNRTQPDNNGKQFMRANPHTVDQF